MMDQHNDAPSAAAAGALAAISPRVRALGLVVGAALLAAAVFTVIAQHETFAAAMRSVADQPLSLVAGRIAIIAGAVFANIVLTGLLFSVLMSRYGRVGILEMQAVIAATTLINYLPLRPGLFGRVAYHRAVNQIPVAGAVKAVVQAMILSALVAGWLALAAASAQWLGVALCAPVLTAPIALALALLGGATVRFWAAAALIRYTEVLLVALRYHAAFALIGAPIDATIALGFACVSVIATMVPFVSNGLGLREWAIGLLAPVIASYQIELGITADLIIRAAELAIITLAGLPATLWLGRRLRHA